MNRKIDIIKYLPFLMQQCIQFIALTDAENIELQKVFEELKKIDNNQFIDTADLDGIKRYEKMLKISSFENEPLESRRMRIKSRWNDLIPYTLNALKQKLNNILGEGNYTISVDYDKYTIYLDSNNINQGWAQEVHFIINNYKPANMIFTNRPLLIDNISINEELNLVIRNYNYKLGKWNLGMKPFMSKDEKGVIKMKEEKSIENNLITHLKEQTLDKVSYAKINDTITIRDFLNKDIIDDKAVIEYIVFKSSGITNIEEVVLYDRDDNPLSTIKLYVPIQDDVELRHIIDITERGDYR